MAKERFEDRKFNAEHLGIIDVANAIIDEYRAAGFTLTLRQLYYQFVARDKLPNKQSEYKRLGGILSAARIAGLIDWSAIEDRTRNLERLASWENPSSIMDSCAASYRENLWRTQPYYPEVWIEKEALVGVVQGICEQYRVPYLACRGYTSQSELYTAGKRFMQARRAGKKALIIHLGDHDPSGIDMTRDNEARTSQFARFGIEMVRVALNRDQIDLYDPPPNPAKESDSRFAGYSDIHGDESWELDALSPTVIAELIEERLTDIIDKDAWERAEKAEKRNVAILESIRDSWDEIAVQWGPPGEDDEE